MYMGSSMPISLFIVCFLIIIITLLTLFFFVPSGTVAEDVPDQGSKGTRTGKVVSSDG
jgi:hypothetical protein